jgi:hypothetical protein
MSEPSSDDDAELESIDAPAGPGLERGKADDAIYEGFQPPPMEWGKAEDGLPSPKVPLHLPVAPPLSPETFVCMADARDYVIRDAWGDVTGSFGPRVVKRAPAGDYYVTLEEAVGSGMPWLAIARAIDPKTLRVRVAPRRPQCAFLRQQMIAFQDNDEHVMVERLCVARRDEQSFFLSVRDQQVYACELRSPRDPESEQRIETFNETKVRLGASRLKADEDRFNLDEELEKAAREAQGGATFSSIFANSPTGEENGR